MNEHDLDAIASWDLSDDNIERNTGPRREPPAVCNECGVLICNGGPTLDGHTFCDRACLDAWVRR